MVDFPNNPEDGTVHSEAGSSWVYRAPPNVWQKLGSGGQQVVIAESALDTGDAQPWQVMGDMMVQWGVEAGVLQNTNPVITFAKPFKSPPSVAVAGSVEGDCWARNITTTTVTLDTGNSSTPQDIKWIAIAQATDEDKKAKSVNGGTAYLGVQEFHDPTGAASWRIIGNTLECWGQATMTGTTTVTPITFPKTFARAPQITAGVQTVNPAASRSHTITAKTATGFDAQVLVAANGNPAPETLNWHASGEWDGIS